MRIAECNEPMASSVQRIIEEKGLKQVAVAEKAGYSKQQFSAMMNGRKVIKPCDILAIASALAVDANALFGRKENG